MKAHAGSDEASLAVKRALSYLLKGDRTVCEMRNYLMRGGFGECAVEKAISQLQRWGYLDDQRVAAGLARSKMEHGQWAPARVRRWLHQKGVSSEHIEEAIQGALEELDEQVLATDALRRYLRTHPGPWDQKKRRRAFAYLARRGFTADLILRAMGDMGKEDKKGQCEDP